MTPSKLTESQREFYADERIAERRAKDRIIEKRAQELCESVKFASEQMADALQDAEHSMYPSRKAKAQSIVTMILEGGNDKEVCDWLREHVHQKAADKALDEYEQVYGVDE